ncbi:MAG: MAPEG family protein [Alphaproteobacteria bacterium]|nr:MAPEG family protein [Alphaproteobacteria bacterium]
MTTDLTMLTWTVLLCILMWVPYILARIGSWGLVNAVGYPESPPATPAWSQRCQRAHLNLVENLAPFAALVLIAHVTGAANETTALCATVFFWARVAHAVTFTLGVPWVRTLTFAASVGAMVWTAVIILTA